MLEKYNYNFEKTFSSLKFVSLRKALIVFVWFINRGTQWRLQSKKSQFRKTVFLKKVFLQATYLNDIFISGGTEDWYWKLKPIFRVIFLSWENTFKKKEYWMVWKNLLKWVHRKGDKKTILQKKLFSRKILLVKVFLKGIVIKGCREDRC